MARSALNRGTRRTSLTVKDGPGVMLTWLDVNSQNSYGLLFEWREPQG